MAIAVGIYRWMTFGALAGGTPVLVGILRVSRHVGFCESSRFEERNIDAVMLEQIHCVRGLCTVWY